MPNFERVEKQRQAYFRKTSPTISDAGKNPLDIKRPYLLAIDWEEENLYPAIRGQDGAQRFFEDRKIKWWRHGPSGDPGGVNRPTRNMASSQIACVNFLLPLIEIDGALRAVLRAIDDDVQDVITIPHKGNSSPVELEWIGVEGPLEEGAPPTRGANTTSVDAFMVAKTDAGRRAYLLEWKYVETYGSNVFLGNGSRGETRRRRYSDLYSAESSSFNGVAPMDELLYEPFYQLMRQRLLADRMVDKSELGLTEIKVVAVVPGANVAYRERITSPPLANRFPNLKTVSDVFRATLKQPDHAYAIVCPSTLVNAVERECGYVASEWVAYQRERYGLNRDGDWALSEAEVQEGIELAELGLAQESAEWPPY